MPSDFSSATASTPPSDELKAESAWIGIGMLIALTAAMAGYVIWILRGL
jgi:hypothetical protein